jgi:uncharacterized integral membrane protein (TIGR00698 family)
MAPSGDNALAARPSATLPANVRLALGVCLCVSIAIVAVAVGSKVPLIGAPLIAIAIGVMLTNGLREPLRIPTLRIGEVSKYALRGGIIVLGGSLNIGDIARTGWDSMPLLLVTIAAGLICALGFGRLLGIDWRMRCLIGMGTTICGASAIAALAPVIRAKAEEIAYAVTVIFFFNMVAVFLFPALCHLFGLSDAGFGLWAGTAVNDTSAVVAAGFAYSQAAGTAATIVKLTRTTLIIPLVIGFGLSMPWLDPERTGKDASLARRVYDAIPMFIVLFLAAAVLNTMGLFGGYAPVIQNIGRWVLVVALAAVGLQGHWRAFVGAGMKPLLLGFLTWFVVAGTSLAIQNWTHAL